MAEDIESEAAKAVMFDKELVAPHDRAHITDLKAQFDDEFSKIKAQFESCASDRAQCSVSTFEEQVGATAQLTKLQELKEELLLEVPMGEVDEDANQDSMGLISDGYF